MFSCIRLKPGPLVALIALTPPREAPMQEQMLAISSSIWTKTPPRGGSRRAMISAISDDGVIG